MQQSFATMLRWWRRHRALSQLELAGRADISQRHLSFLELGRASPSREMVMRLATALDVPLRQQNALLIAAGFAPVWRQTNLAAPELSQVSDALDYMLAQQEPFQQMMAEQEKNYEAYLLPLSAYAIFNKTNPINVYEHFSHRCGIRCTIGISTTAKSALT